MQKRLTHEKYHEKYHAKYQEFAKPQLKFLRENLPNLEQDDISMKYHPALSL